MTDYIRWTELYPYFLTSVFSGCDSKPSEIHFIGFEPKQTWAKSMKEDAYPLWDHQDLYHSLSTLVYSY